MLDGTPEPTPGANGEPTPKPVAVDSFTKEQVDKAAANARREAESKLTEAQERLAAFEAKEKERLDAELSEIDKVKKQHEETLAQLEIHKKDSEWRTAWELKEAEAIEKDMEELDDDTKELIVSLPLEKRRAAVSKFKASSASPNPDATKWVHLKQFGIPTLPEVTALRDKYGAASKEYRDAYKKYAGIGT